MSIQYSIYERFPSPCAMYDTVRSSTSGRSNEVTYFGQIITQTSPINTSNKSNCNDRSSAYAEFPVTRSFQSVLFFPLPIFPTRLMSPSWHGVLLQKALVCLFSSSVRSSLCIWCTMVCTSTSEFPKHHLPPTLPPSRNFPVSLLILSGIYTVHLSCVTYTKEFYMRGGASHRNITASLKSAGNPFMYNPKRSPVSWKWFTTICHRGVPKTMEILPMFMWVLIDLLVRCVCSNIYVGPLWW